MFRNLASKRRWGRLAAHWIAFTGILNSVTPAFADGVGGAQQTQGNDGQALGVQLLNGFTMPTQQSGFMPPPTNRGAFFNYDANGNLIGYKKEVWTQEVIPGFDPADTQSQQDLGNLRNNPAAIQGAAGANAGNLGAGSDSTAQAYQALRAGSQNPYSATFRTGVRSDTAFAQSGSIMNGTSPWLNSILTGCVTVKRPTSGGTESTTYSETEVCSQVRKPELGACSATRDVQLVPVETKVVYEFGLPGVNDGVSAGEPAVPSLCVGGEAGKYCGTANDTASCNADGDKLGTYCASDENVASDFGCMERYYDEGWGEWFERIDGRCCTSRGQEHSGRCQAILGGYTGSLSVGFTAIGNGADRTVQETILGVPTQVTYRSFNPEAHSLAAGQYLVANYVASGAGVTQGALVTAGTAGDGWAFNLPVILASARGLQITATLYKVEKNDFAGSCTPENMAGWKDGFCSASGTCRDYASTRTIDGVTISETGATSGYAALLKEWGDSGDPRLQQMCWQADLTTSGCGEEVDCSLPDSNCEPKGEDECFVPAGCDPNDPNPTEACKKVCVDRRALDWQNNLGDPGWVDNCQELLARPECHLTTQRPCTGDMEGEESGECYERSVIFRCDRQQDIPVNPTGAADEVTTCGDTIRCMGNECHNLTPETNNDFNTVAGLAGSMDYIAMHTKCDNPNDPSTCRFFEGSQEWCKKPRRTDIDPLLLFLPDCCKQGKDAGKGAANFNEYIELITTGYQMVSSPYWAQFTGWNFSSTGIGSTIEAGSNALNMMFRSGWNSVMDMVGMDWAKLATNDLTSATVGGGTQTAAWTGMSQLIAQGCYEVIGTFSPALAESIFATTGEGAVTGWASTGLGPVFAQIAAFLSVLMWIYLIYMFIKILASIIFKCEDEELQFGIKLVNRSCHYLGKKCIKKVWTGFGRKCLYDKLVYCCYNTPFGRIMAEQIKGINRPASERSTYVGPEWGTAKAPRCDGITAAEMEEVSWERLDLSEWVAIMKETGLMPNAATIMERPIPTDQKGGGGPDQVTVDGIDTNTAALSTAKPIVDSDRQAKQAQGVSAIVQNKPEYMPWYQVTPEPPGPPPPDPDPEPDPDPDPIDPRPICRRDNDGHIQCQEP